MLGSHASRSAISDRLPAFVITALLAASGVVLATLAEGGVAMAQDDACSLITTEELMRITATSEVEISPDGEVCDWYATTPEFEAVSVELLLDAGDAAAYASEYPEAEQIEIAGASGYRVRLDDDFAFAIVQLPSSAPLITVSLTTSEDAVTVATALLEIAASRIMPEGPPPPTAAPTDPAQPTAMPTPTAERTAPAAPTPTVGGILCAVIGPDEISDLMGRSLTTFPFQDSCYWATDDPATEGIVVGVTIETGTLGGIIAAAPGGEATAIEGYPAYAWSGPEAAGVWLWVAIAEGLMAVEVRHTDPNVDRLEVAAEVATRALPLVTDSGPPSMPPAVQPTTPPQTATPPPTLAPTPIADASDCRDRILAADLRNSATIDEVDECRFIEGGADAAAEVLAAGGTREQLWAAVWVYASSGDDPAPLRPMASHDDPSIRVMAGAALTGLGDPAGPTALATALLDDTVLVGSLPPKTVSEFAVYSLSRHVIGPDAPGRSTGPGDQPTVAGAWKSWLDEHGDALVYDPSTGEWSVR